MVDKPKGITSHDVVARVRKLLGKKKVGHAGTLDPLASGLLVLGLDSGTKLLSYLFGLDKQYLATFRLGQSTVSDDAEGAVTFERAASHITKQSIEEAIQGFLGEISQRPSAVSAIKVEGKRAYDLVRKGVEVELKPRSVKIFRFELMSEIRYVGEFIEFDAVVDCSTGTYIRALARDLGQTLGVGGHIRELRRTMIGEFRIEDASALDEAIRVLDELSIAKMLWPTVELDFPQAQAIMHGKQIHLSASATVAADYKGKLLAVLEPVGGSLRSLRVFPEAFHD
jgi:tRNA pseudouridine55 synthase